jgi:hypothetical protein
MISGRDEKKFKKRRLFSFFVLVNRRWRAIRFHRRDMSIYLHIIIQHQMDIQL